MNSSLASACPTRFYSRERRTRTCPSGLCAFNGRRHVRKGENGRGFHLGSGRTSYFKGRRHMGVGAGQPRCPSLGCLPPPPLYSRRAFLPTTPSPPPRPPPCVPDGRSCPRLPCPPRRLLRSPPQPPHPPPVYQTGVLAQGSLVRRAASYGATRALVSCGRVLVSASIGRMLCFWDTRRSSFETQLTLHTGSQVRWGCLFLGGCLFQGGDASSRVGMPMSGWGCLCQGGCVCAED